MAWLPLSATARCIARPDSAAAGQSAVAEREISEFIDSLIDRADSLEAVAERRGAEARRLSAISDSLTAAATGADTARRENWVAQLLRNGFKLNDPTINYPRFARFCLKVYNWGDRTFNSYDSAYVVGTGKNWKLIARNENWMENYMMIFNEHQYVRINSEPYFDLGASLNFMAVGLSYTVNAKTLFTHTMENRKRFNFSFTCSLFAANILYSTVEGGSKINHFCDYPGLSKHPYDFNGITTRSFYCDAYYFFNHNRYSQAAAYCFSKYQLKSAGSWIAGFTFTRQNISMDFESLPPEMLSQLPVDNRRFLFHYRDYCLTGGYAYNFAIRPHRWLVNLTILPSVGYRRTYEDATDANRPMFSTNLRGTFAVVYNNRDFFASARGEMITHAYFARDYDFINTNGSLTAIVGIRF